METMTKFVEKGHDLIKCQQGRLTRGGNQIVPTPGNVLRRLDSELLHIGVHPSAALL